MISSRKGQNLNSGRVQKLNVNDYFAKLKITMEELRIMNKTECILTVDEKGCSLSLHR